MNSTQITITIQTHKLFNCFPPKRCLVRRQDFVVIGEDTFNTWRRPHQKSISSSDFWQNRQVCPGSIQEILNWLRFCTKIIESKLVPRRAGILPAKQSVPRKFGIRNSAKTGYSVELGSYLELQSSFGVQKVSLVNKFTGWVQTALFIKVLSKLRIGRYTFLELLLFSSCKSFAHSIFDFRNRVKNEPWIWPVWAARSLWFLCVSPMQWALETDCREWSIRIEQNLQNNLPFSG